MIFNAMESFIYSSYSKRVTKKVNKMKNNLLSRIASAAVLAGAFAFSGELRVDGGYRTDNFNKDSEEVLLARMIFGEARNCSDSEKIAIAYTAINRAKDGKKWNGETVKEAILKPFQYSCFNKNDSNRIKLMNPEQYDRKSFEKCLQISKDVLQGRCKDSTHGATHYHTTPVKPSWSTNTSMVNLGKIGDSKHLFYREK